MSKTFERADIDNTATYRRKRALYDENEGWERPEDYHLIHEPQREWSLSEWLRSLGKEIKSYVA